LVAISNLTTTAEFQLPTSKFSNVAQF